MLFDGFLYENKRRDIALWVKNHAELVTIMSFYEREQTTYRIILNILDLESNVNMHPMGCEAQLRWLKNAYHTHIFRQTFSPIKWGSLVGLCT